MELDVYDLWNSLNYKKCKHKSLLGDRWISLRFADDIPHIYSNETFRLFIDWDLHTTSRNPMLMNQWNNIEKSDALYTVKEYALTNLFYD